MRFECRHIEKYLGADILSPSSLEKRLKNTLRLIIRHSSESCQFKRLRHTLNVFFGAGKYIFFCICLMNRRKDVKQNQKCSSFKTKYLTALNPISFSDFTSLSISLWKGVVEVKIENKKISVGE